jgi:hypothetical protein
MPGKRSDPKKLAADRQEIADQMENFVRRERVGRSRVKARADAEAFKATGEGTLGEAWENLLQERAEKRHVKKYGGPPQVGGAAQVGFRRPPTEA